MGFRLRRLRRSSPRPEAVDLLATTHVDVEKVVKIGRPESRVPSLQGARYLQGRRIVRAEGRGFEGRPQIRIDPKR